MKSIFLFLLTLGMIVAISPALEAQSAASESSALSFAVTVQPKVADLKGAHSVPGGAGSVSPAELMAVHEAIDKFKLLFEQQDADLLKKEIWPSMSTKHYRAMKAVFDVVSQVTLHESCSGVPNITNDTAALTCNETLGYRVGGDKRPLLTNPIEFRLKKQQDGTWYVDDRTAKPPSH